MTSEPTQRSLSEHESRQMLKPFGIPMVESILAKTSDEAKEAAAQVGYPLVLKASGEKILHKTEMSLVKLGISNDGELEEAFLQIVNTVPKSALEGVLVQPFVKTSRELIAGMKRDEHFGPCVLFGLGGIFAEALQDVVFRVAPLDEHDALDMLNEIQGSKVLDEIRGEPAADRQALAKLLLAIGKAGLENDNIEEIDLNPVLLDGPHPVAVDALVILRA